MRGALLHLIVCAAAATAPFAISAEPRTMTVAEVGADADFPGWPSSFEGRALRVLPPTELDVQFARDLPGRVCRFSDGEQEIVIRWSPVPTRLVHPSAVCFRAHGWTVEPSAMFVGADGRAWGRFRAERDGERLEVRELVEDAAGGAWPEPTAWYWASLLGGTRGPAWAYTVARRE